jgi:hypothetical protein
MDIKKYAKAFVALIVTAAAYLVGILGQEDDLGDLSFVQWLGLVIFMGAAYGITAAVPNKGYVSVEELEKLNRAA